MRTLISCLICSLAPTLDLHSCWEEISLRIYMPWTTANWNFYMYHQSPLRAKPCVLNWNIIILKIFLWCWIVIMSRKCLVISRCEVVCLSGYVYLRNLSLFTLVCPLLLCKCLADGRVQLRHVFGAAWLSFCFVIAGWDNKPSLLNAGKPKLPGYLPYHNICHCSIGKQTITTHYREDKNSLFSLKPQSCEGEKI